MAFITINGREFPPPDNMADLIVATNVSDGKNALGEFIGPAGASFRFVSPRGRGVRHPYGSSSAAAFMVAAPVTYTLPAFLNAPDSSTTALVLPFATFTTRSATP